MSGVLSLEFTVEPFAQGQPGPHVQAAWAAAESSGLKVDVGPFGTTVVGPDDQVMATLAEVVRQSLAAGATRVSLQLTNC